MLLTILSIVSRRLAIFITALAFIPCAKLGSAAEPASSFPKPRNTQAEDLRFLTPAEALASIQAPPGFEVTLFANEPEVQQPIAQAFDARGRLWVAENYTYAEASVNHDLSQRDRIVILADRNGDGRSDERKVFWDHGQRLTSVELGFGGVWALAPPQLLFIPDRNGDDVPDGEPEVVLDGWDAGASRHNFANGLRWGPDGWLYGRQGILVTSHVGPPGLPIAERTALNCAIWRLHPTTRKFEVVCQGTTNPWGHDWDEHGQLFFINTVIGHLWHALPGAHFRRMYGEDLNPQVYELIEQTADHFHWDTANEDWTALRTKALSTGTDAAGGGHAHSGLMIYPRDGHWPEEYRGEMFTLNFHGRRINRDHLQREGATYVGKHRPDFLTVGDPYFRGIDLTLGPDGGVSVLDWSDIGECHENDGVHRTSGRIYKVQWKGNGSPKAPLGGDLSKLSSLELATAAPRQGEWIARQARRLLQERTAAGEDMRAVRTSLLSAYEQSESVPNKLRAMWCLHAVAGLTDAWLVEQLQAPNEHIRVWAIQLLVDSGSPSAEAMAALQKHAPTESSGLVLTYLASALQRLPIAERWAIAAALVEHAELADDRVLPLMIWYGLESAALSQPDQAVALLDKSQMPKVSQFIARRLTGAIETQPEAVAKLTQFVSSSNDIAGRRAVLQGMADALQGWLKASPPDDWQSTAAQLEKQADPQTQQLARELSVVFGSGRAIDQLKAIIIDGKQPIAFRRRAMRSLAEVRAEGAADLLIKFAADRELADEAIRSLGLTAPPNLAALLLDKYPATNALGKSAILEVLASRPETALALLSAVSRGAIDRGDVQPFQLRQMQLLGQQDIQPQIERLWPQLRLIAGEKLQKIAEYREDLQPASLAGRDSLAGQRLFEQSCAKCHKLFGRGEGVGPELTGAQRNNLNYWLENIVDPSATVATSFRMSLIAMEDGRVLNGVVLQQTDRTLTVQTPTEKLVLDRRSVEQVKPSELSLMPDGLLAQLSDEQVRDLFAYLMSPGDPIQASKSGPQPSSTGGP